MIHRQDRPGRDELQQRVTRQHDHQDDSADEDQDRCLPRSFMAA
jgi:hypothetical protein